MASIGISGKKPLITKPPDKGSFPLDHDGECKQVMIDYLKCLQKTDCENASCRDLAKKYLQCRMDKQLMAKEEWSKLGFQDSE